MILFNVNLVFQVCEGMCSSFEFGDIRIIDNDVTIFEQHKQTCECCQGTGSYVRYTANCQGTSKQFEIEQMDKCFCSGSVYMGKYVFL